MSTKIKILLVVVLLGSALLISQAQAATTILQVTGGGTGWGAIKAHTVILGNDTSQLSTTSPSTAGFVLTSNGVNSDPTFQVSASGGITALGSGYASTTGSTITFSTSTASFNGLTLGMTIQPTAGALLFTPKFSGTLDNTGLTNSSLTVTAGSGLSGGGSVALGSAVTLSSAYNYPFIGGATSSLVAFNGGLTTAGFLSTASSTINASTTITGILTLAGATTTGLNGVDIQTGCFSVLGTCLQTTITGSSAYKQAVKYASTTTIPVSYNYANGVAGVGATITSVGFAAFYIDGNTPSVGDRVLIKNETAGNAPYNGIYTVTQVGSAIAVFILTRATDYNSAADVFPGVANFTNSGTINANTCWILSNTSSVTIGTTALTYDDACGTGSAILNLGPTGQLQSGSTQTLATSSSATNGLTPSLVITASGNTQTFTSSISGTLTVAGGGTGSTTLTGLLLGNTTSAVQTYGGTSCTNQFFRSLNNVGTASCATVSASDVSLANLTATDNTLTFSGTYNGSTARTIGLALGNANTWTALQQFGANSSTTMESAGSAYFGKTATSTFSTTGVLTLASALTVGNGGTGQVTFTSSQLLYGNGTNALSSVATTSETCTSPLSCTAHDVLTGGGAITLGTVPIAKGGTATTTFYNGGVNFWDTTLGTISQGRAIKDFFFDVVNARLGIGTSSPVSSLTVGSGTASSSATLAEYAYGASGNNATSTAATISPSTSSHLVWPIGTVATTLTLCNFQPGQTLTVRVVNPVTTAGALTWAVCAGNQLYWPAGGAQSAQTTTGGHYDLWSFIASANVGSTTRQSDIIITGGLSGY